jgi:fatty-acyl-CoA synthase/long-chain acyl-CoA synthetase
MVLKDEILVRHVHKYPDKVAVVFEGQRFTFRELNDRVNSLTQALMDLGVNKGDRIAMVADNCHQYLEAALAAVKGGMVITTVNPTLSQRELSYLINNSEANTVVFSQNYADLVNALRDELELVKNFIVIGKLEGTRSYEELIASYPAKEPQVKVEDDDLYMLASSGGTTGLPKQVMHTYRSTVAMVFSVMPVFGMRHEDISLFGGPLFWGPLIPWQGFPHLYMGCTLVIPKELTPHCILKAIEEEKVTDLFLGTALVPALATSPDVNKYDHSSLRRIVLGGTPLSMERFKKAINVFGNIFAEFYGATEIALVTCLAPEEIVLEGPEGVRVNSCGRESLSAEFKIVDEQDNEVPLGRVGEVIAKGKHVMAGYWKAPKATEEAMRGGYFHTGDLGKVDEEGYLYLVGRKKDVITSQGKLVSPSEVEDIIYRHSSVLEAVVIGVPDEQLGEAVKAVVVLRPEARATTAEIVSLCRDYLPPHAIPRSVEFVDNLPKTAFGKILRRELKDKYIERIAQ